MEERSAWTERSHKSNKHLICFLLSVRDVMMEKAWLSGKAGVGGGEV